MIVILDYHNFRSLRRLTLFDYDVITKYLLHLTGNEIFVYLRTIAGLHCSGFTIRCHVLEKTNWCNSLWCIQRAQTWKRLWITKIEKNTLTFFQKISDHFEDPQQIVYNQYFYMIVARIGQVHFHIAQTFSSRNSSFRVQLDSTRKFVQSTKELYQWSCVLRQFRLSCWRQRHKRNHMHLSCH